MLVWMTRAALRCYSGSLEVTPLPREARMSPAPSKMVRSPSCAFASYYKGIDFIRECRRQGCRTLLLTSNSIKDEKLAAREHRRNLLHARRAEGVEAGRRPSWAYSYMARKK